MVESVEPKPTDIFMSDIITVHVGKDPDKFYVHRDVLCRESKFFEACFIPHTFNESSTNQVDLPDVEFESFRLIAKYLYSGDIPNVETSLMIKLYIVADKLLMNAFKNSVMDRLRQTMSEQNSTMEFSQLKMVQNLAAHTQLPICRYVMDQLAFDIYHLPEGYVRRLGCVSELIEAEGMSGLECPELLQGLLTRIMFKRNSKEENLRKNDPMHVEGCAYHDHENGEVCSKNLESAKAEGDNEDAR